MPDRQIEPRTPSRTVKLLGVALLLFFLVLFVLVPVLRNT